MKKQHIMRLENRLEQIVEGTFAGLFGKQLSAQELALQLARAMEDHITRVDSGDLIAPDQYTIHLRPDIHTQLLKKQPHIAQTLGEHLVELAALSGYHLAGKPLVKLLAVSDLANGRLAVTASYSDRNHHRTEALQQVVLPVQITPQRNHPQFVINGQSHIDLQGSVINLGRDEKNHIVIDDPYISRHHIQLRLRGKSYILFDVNSRGGTTVNNIRVREHRLQSGDVVRIGRTHILYLEDDEAGDGTPTIETQKIDPDS